MFGRKKYSALWHYGKAGIDCLLILIVLITTLFSACNQAGEKTGHKQSRVPRSFVNVKGSYSLYPLVQTWADIYQQSHPTVKITVIPAGSNKALSESELLRTDLGLFSDDRSKIHSRNIIPFAVARDVVVPVMNRFNPAASAIYYRGLSKEELYRIFVTGDLTSWNEIPGIAQQVDLTPFTRVDLCGAASIWADYFGTFQENLKGIPVNGDPGMYSAIKNTKGGIGFANIRYVYNDSTGLAFEPLMVVPLDANKNNRADTKELIFGSLPQLMYSIDKGYLDPGLIRDLYLLVSTDNLKKSAYDFLQWVLDSGQVFVEEAGYISLQEDELDDQIILLDSISSFVVSDKNKIKPLKP